MSARSDFVQQMYQAGLDAGLSDAAARVMAAQAAHESNFGASAPGYNYFGVKAGRNWTGATQLLWTHERTADGSTVMVQAAFRAYATPEEAIADRVAFMDSRFPDFNQAATVGDALDALRNGVYGNYYTDDQATYEGAINRYNQEYLGGTPVPPGGIPGVPLPRPRPTDTLRDSATMGDTGRAAMSLTSELVWGKDGPSPEETTIRQIIPSADYQAARDAASVGGLASVSDDMLSAYLAPQIAPIQMSPAFNGAGGLSFETDLMTPDDTARVKQAMDVAVEAVGSGPGSWGDFTKAAQVPVPAPKPLTAPTVAAQPPQPMPGRPAAIDALPKNTSGSPDDRQKAVPAAPPKTIRIGKHDYVIGSTYDQGGFHYVVTEHGIEKSRISTGAPTILSSVVGQKVGEAAAAAKDAIGAAANNAGDVIKDTAGQAVDAAKNKAGEVLSGLGSMLGNLFGGPPPADGIVVTDGGATKTGRPVMLVDGSNWWPELAPIPKSASVSVTPRPYKPQEVDIALPKSTGDKAFDEALNNDPVLVLSRVHDQREDAQVKAAPLPSLGTVKPSGTVKPPQSFTENGNVFTGRDPYHYNASTDTITKNWAPNAAAIYTPINSSGSPDDRQASQGAKAADNAMSQALAQVAQSRLNDNMAGRGQPVTKTVTEVAANPEYAAWEKLYGGGGALGSATQKLQDIHDLKDDAIIKAQSSAPIPEAPAKTILKKKTITLTGGEVKVTSMPKIAPVFVDARTGAPLHPETIHTYDAATNTWDVRTVYRPDTSTKPAAVVKKSAASPTIRDGTTRDGPNGKTQVYVGGTWW